MENLKPQLQRVLFFAILAALLWLCWQGRDALARVAGLGLSDLLLLLLCYAVFQFLHAAMASQLLKRRGRVVGLMPMAALGARASLSGQLALIPGGMLAGRAGALKQIHQVPLPLSMGMTAYLSLVLIFTNSALGLLAGAYTLTIGMAIPPLYWLVLSATLLLCVSIVLGIYKMGGVYTLPRSLQIWVANLYSIFSGTDANEVLRSIGLAALAMAVQAFAFFLLFSGFGLMVPTVYLVFIAVFCGLLLVVSVTPGNLGVRELVVFLLIAHLDLSGGEIFAVAVMDRLLQLVVTASFGLTLKQGAAPATASLNGGPV